MDQFEGKVAVITGAANPRGIGFTAGPRFAGLGCKVVLADTIVDAIARDAFWAHPTVDDERLAGGRQRPVIEWENELYRRAVRGARRALRAHPYLWGPSNLMG